jgi:hypothetical protein
MSLSDDFLADPFAYCRQQAAGGQGKILIVAERETVKLQAKTGYSSVAKGHRVSYCRIAQNVSIGQQMQSVTIGAGSEAVVAEIKGTPPNPQDYGKRAGEWFPCYYLPWQAQATYRITLKHLAHAAFTEEPRIFLTSTVDGCSVVVEGSPDHPTVYHLNDAGGGGNPPPQNTLVTQQGYWDPKRTTMETRFQNARSPKAVRDQAAAIGAPALPGAKGVHAMDYMDVTEANLPALNTNNDRTVHADRARTMIKDAKAVQYETSLYKPYGTVFGWMQNNAWRFFYQQRAVIFYMYRVTDKKNSVSTVAVPRQCGFLCDEFWPNGSGRAVGKVLKP